MGKFRKSGHDLLDELDQVLEAIHSQAQDRHQVVQTRLQELEAEKHALSTVQNRVAAVQGSKQGEAK